MNCTSHLPTPVTHSALLPSLKDIHQLQGVLPVIPQLLLYHLVTLFCSVLSCRVLSPRLQPKVPSIARRTRNTHPTSRTAPRITHRRRRHSAISYPYIFHFGRKISIHIAARHANLI